MKQIRERLVKKLKDFMSCYADVGNFRLKHIFKIMIAKESQRSYEGTRYPQITAGYLVSLYFVRVQEFQKNVLLCIMTFILRNSGTQNPDGA